MTLYRAAVELQAGEHHLRPGDEVDIDTSIGYLRQEAQSLLSRGLIEEVASDQPEQPAEPADPTVEEKMGPPPARKRAR